MLQGRTASGLGLVIALVWAGLALGTDIRPVHAQLACQPEAGATPMRPGSMVCGPNAEARRVDSVAGTSTDTYTMAGISTVRRYLVPFLLVCALTALALLVAPSHEVAQGKAKFPVVAPKQLPLQVGRTPNAKIAVPSTETLTALIRSTLLSLDALRAGNDTVPRDVVSPSFREASSSGQFVLSTVCAQDMDPASVSTLPPKPHPTPIIDQNKRLQVAGYSFGEPLRLNVEVILENVADQWHVHGISVTPAKSASPAREDASESAPAAE